MQAHALPYSYERRANGDRHRFLGAGLQAWQEAVIGIDVEPAPESSRELHPDMPEPDPAEAAAMAGIGLLDDEITTWADTTAFSGQKFDAPAVHASQGENILFLKMGKERFGELMGMETFVRVQDSTGAAVPENDLIAGLR